MLPCCHRHLHYSLSNAATWFVLELFIILVYMSFWNSSFLFCMLIGYDLAQVPNGQKWFHILWTIFVSENISEDFNFVILHELKWTFPNIFSILNVLAIFFNIYLLHIYVFQFKIYGFSHKGVISGAVKTCIFFICFKNQGVWWVLYVVLCEVHHLDTDKHNLLFNWGGITLLLTTIVKYIYMLNFYILAFKMVILASKKGLQLCSTQGDHQSWMVLILSCIFMFVM